MKRDAIYCGYPGGRPVWPWGGKKKLEVIKSRQLSAREEDTSMRILGLVAGGVNTSKDIATAMDCSIGNVNSYCKKLEQAGQISRRLDESLNRAMAISITKRGRMQLEGRL